MGKTMILTILASIYIPLSFVSVACLSSIYSGRPLIVFWQGFFSMNFSTIQNLPNLNLYWRIAAPLAAVTIVFPVYGPGVLRWMVLAPRTYVRLLLVLFIDLIALSATVLVVDFAFYRPVRIVLGIFVLLWYAIFPLVRASEVVREEIMAFKRSKNRSLRAYIRIVKFILKNEFFPGSLFVLLYFSLEKGYFLYSSVALFFSYRFVASWRVYQRLARS